MQILKNLSKCFLSLAESMGKKEFLSMRVADVFHNIDWKYWKEILNYNVPEKYIKKRISYLTYFKLFIEM